MTKFKGENSKIDFQTFKKRFFPHLHHISIQDEQKFEEVNDEGKSIDALYNAAGMKGYS